jgi:hypothetical protein
MRKDSAQRNYNIYIQSALLACHANHGLDGFRPKQFKFYLEIITNWMEYFFDGPGLDLQNTQVIRILDSMVEKSSLKVNKEKSYSLYQFTPAGLLDSVNEIVKVSTMGNLEEFFFKHHFVSFYKDQIGRLIKEESAYLPKSYEIEIKHLLNPDNLLEAQIELVEIEIEKLTFRIEDGIKQTRFTDNLLSQKMSLNDILNAVEKHHPYQLNYQKNMKELFLEMNENMKKIELVQAPASRVETLWKPILSYLTGYLNNLKELRS